MNYLESIRTVADISKEIALREVRSREDYDIHGAVSTPSLHSFDFAPVDWGWGDGFLCHI